MRLHLITIGQPKLSYAKLGWEEYIKRLGYFHTVRVTHIPDKWAYNGAFILQTAGNAYKVALVIDGKQYTSLELADFLDKRALEAREMCFLIGGPEGLPENVINESDLQLGLSRLTFPHDLVMVILAETLYRASAISAGQPYHK
jgi:23S rRNA (pseudouridine1915-N3)-methyltransferase